MHRFTQTHCARHARTAFDRVQLAHQVACKLAIIRIAREPPQIGCNRRQQLGRFRQEHFEQIGVELIAQPRCCGLFGFSCFG